MAARKQSEPGAAAELPGEPIDFEAFFVGIQKAGEQIGVEIDEEAVKGFLRKLGRAKK